MGQHAFLRSESRAAWHRVTELDQAPQHLGRVGRSDRRCGADADIKLNCQCLKLQDTHLLKSREQIARQRCRWHREPTGAGTSWSCAVLPADSKIPPRPLGPLDFPCRTRRITRRSIAQGLVIESGRSRSLLCDCTPSHPFVDLVCLTASAQAARHRAA